MDVAGRFLVVLQYLLGIFRVSLSSVPVTIYEAIVYYSYVSDLSVHWSLWRDGIVYVFIEVFPLKIVLSGVWEWQDIWQWLLLHTFFFFFFLSPEVKVFKNRIYTDFYSSWNWTYVKCSGNGEDWVIPLLQEKTGRVLTVSGSCAAPSCVHKITHTQPVAGLWTLSWTRDSRARILASKSRHLNEFLFLWIISIDVCHGRN